MNIMEDGPILGIHSRMGGTMPQNSLFLSITRKGPGWLAEMQASTVQPTSYGWASPHLMDLSWHLENIWAQQRCSFLWPYKKAKDDVHTHSILVT